MNRQECGDYLVHRLRQVGWNDDPSFEPGAIDVIFAYSGGIPRRINTLCNRLLLFGFLDDLHHFSAAEVDRVIADLEAENGEESDGRSSSSHLMCIPVTQRPVTERIEGLEKRVAQQELSMRRVAIAIHDYLSGRPAHHR